MNVRAGHHARAFGVSSAFGMGELAIGRATILLKADGIDLTPLRRKSGSRCCGGENAVMTID